MFILQSSQELFKIIFHHMFEHFVPAKLAHKIKMPITFTMSLPSSFALLKISLVLSIWKSKADMVHKDLRAIGFSRPCYVALLPPAL